MPSIVNRAVPLSARISLEELDNNVRQSQASAFAEGTLRNLTMQWLKYLSFCLFHGLDPVPASYDTLCRYAQFLSMCLKSHGALLCYLSGVKTLHVLLNMETKQFDALLLKLTLRGLHRNNKHVPQQAPPVTPHILTSIYNILDFDNEDDVIFWAVVLVGFFLLLRKCNLVPDSSTTFDVTKQLARKDFEFLHDHARVTLHWTKNHQYTNEPLVFSLPVITNSELCPVTAVLAVLNLVQGNPTDSVFQRSDGSCYSYYMLQKKLAWVSQQLQIEPKLTSHSLRAGGATAAFLAGVPAEVIKVLGHWKSDAYQKYIRMPEKARMAAGVLLKHSIQCLSL